MYSQYHLPVEGKAIVERVCLQPDVPAVPPCKLPFEGLFPELSNGFKVQKLLVGVSDTESLPSPAATEKLCGVKSLPFPLLSVHKESVLKLFGVKLLPLPELSLPSVVAVVPELSEKFK